MADSLSGIGLVKAQAIVNFRNSQGEFLHVDELQDVPGIGEITFASIKHLVAIEDSSLTGASVDTAAEKPPETATGALKSASREPEISAGIQIILELQPTRTFKFGAGRLLIR